MSCSFGATVPRFKLKQAGGRERKRRSLAGTENESKGAHPAERKPLVHYLQNVISRQTSSVCCKAHLQALLALRHGNGSEILGPSFGGWVPVWSVMTLRIQGPENFGGVGWFLLFNCSGGRCGGAAFSPGTAFFPVADTTVSLSG